MKRAVFIIICVLALLSAKAQPVPAMWMYSDPRIQKLDQEFWLGVLSPVIGTIEMIDSARYTEYWQSLLYQAYIRYSDPRFQSIRERQLRATKIKQQVDSGLRMLFFLAKNHKAYLGGVIIGIAISPKIGNFKVVEIGGIRRITKLTLELEECEVIVDFKAGFWKKITRDHASFSAMRRGKSLFLLPNEDYISTVLIGFNPYQKKPHFNKFHQRYQLVGEVFGTGRKYKLVLENMRIVGKRAGKPIYKADGFNFYPLDNIRPFDLKKIK